MSMGQATSPRPNKPPISVLMPVYNGERYVAEAIDSVLAQTRRDFELIVVNDGSSDGSRNLILRYEDPRIRLIDHERNLGLIAALNGGLAAAEGTWIVRADCDDVNDPRRLEIQIGAAEAAGWDVCFAGTEELYPDGTRVPGAIDALPWGARRWLSLFRNAYGAHPAACFRRDAIRNLGGYGTEFIHAEDYDLWDRCAAAGLRIGATPERLVTHRIYPENTSARHADRQAETMRAIRHRALRRLLPDLTREESDSLGWLLQGFSAKREGRSQRPGLSRFRSLVVRYFDEVTHSEERRLAWTMVAESLARRLPLAESWRDQCSMGLLTLEAIVRARHLPRRRGH